MKEQWQSTARPWVQILYFWIFSPQMFPCSEFFYVFFLERPFEMFLQYSRNGIVIGSIDDVMSGFHSLIGSINQNELPTPPSTGE